MIRKLDHLLIFFWTALLKELAKSITVLLKSSLSLSEHFYQVVLMPNTFEGLENTISLR